MLSGNERMQRTPSARGRGTRKVLRFGIVVVVWNVIAAIAATAANWPSQFGRVGTDAKADVLTAGTATSAPALPIVVLLLALLMIRAGKAWAAFGLAGYGIVALLFIAGGVGELFAQPTRDTPRAVLVTGGLVAVAIAIVMLVLTVIAFRERRQAR